jgi:LPPG:FO 2-phospho-L-lactate transferase
VKIALLSGGVGGARFASGVVDAAGAEALTIIGNVGDDVEVLGLHVSPDLDSIIYALAGLADDERGWGRAYETWNALESAAQLGGEAWFRLGDRDLGLHLVRTQALRRGESLSAVTARIADRLGVLSTLLPATGGR